MQLRSLLQQIEEWDQYKPYRELLKHKNEIKAWLHVDAGRYFVEYLTAQIVNFSTQLASNYMTPKGEDVSMVIRGRIFMLQDILGIEDNLDNYNKIKSEIAKIESGGQ